MEKPNETIMLAELKAEYNKKSNDIARRKQQLDLDRAKMLQEADERYHGKKRDLLRQAADIRAKKVGIPFDDSRRYDYGDELRNIDDELSVIRDERDIEARDICHRCHAERARLDDEHRELGEWYDAETIRIKKEVMAAKEAAKEEEGGEQ